MALYKSPYLYLILIQLRDLPGKSKVAYFNDVIVRQEDIGWFQIAMDDVLLMNILATYKLEHNLYV